jgi:ATP-binding cassette subfamily F protein 3
MLQVQNLHKAFGRKLLFEDVSFTMTAGERLGLVGRNGSGKTTLLRLITGEEEADAGILKMPRGQRVGYLSQHLRFEGGTILEEACRGLPMQEGGWQEVHRAEAALLGLGFRTSDFERAPAELSGGFQVRLQLAQLLISEPNLLLLDEPTNYLDIVSIRWLQRLLRAWPNELLVITHDRDFMDRVTTHTMAIHRRKVRRVPGDTTKLYDVLAQEEEIHEKTRINEERSRKQSERFINRFRYKASKARAVQSRIKMLEKREQLQELQDEATLEFRFRAAEFPGKFMLEAKKLSFGYTEGEPLLEDFHLSVKKGDRIAVVGKNGKGKTTLMNLLDGQLTPSRGEVTRNPNLRMAHFGQNNIDRLQPDKTVEEEILDVHPDHTRRAARGICGVMMFEGDDALKKVEVLSGGERARVLLGKLLVSPANLLLLDEATNHLDMESVDSLIAALGVFPGAVLMVTHNQRVLHALATRLVVFDDGQVRVVEGTYADFLERVGWADEAQGSSEAPPKRQSRSVSKKDLRRLRAEIIQERSAALRDLEQRLKELETAIAADEERLKEVNEALSGATGGDSTEVLRLSREFETLQEAVDRRFQEYTRLSTQHEDRRREFDRRLEELDDG